MKNEKPKTKITFTITGEIEAEHLQDTLSNIEEVLDTLRSYASASATLRIPETEITL